MATDKALESQPKSKKMGGSLAVGLGIFLSRIAGFIRDRAFAHYLGSSDAADAFRAAFKIPNILQNLFGEGVLSASFVPAYSKLLGDENHEDAERLASGVFAWLGLAVAIIVGVGLVATPYLIDIIAPGFTGEKRELTILLVRIFFPGTGLLVLSAWCLGILNSHHRFLLSYTAPVVWNAAILGALLYFGPRQDQNTLATTTAWALVAGSALQFLVQLPAALALVGHLRPRLERSYKPLRTVGKNFAPVVVARGVVQIGAYVDSAFASWLPAGAVSVLAYGQTIGILPVSLFGMAVSAAELPALSRVKGNSEEIATQLRTRLGAGLSRIAFFVVPSTAAFFFLGDHIAGALYQTGAFTHDTTIAVWGCLAGSGVGLLASTQGRLYASAFYAMQDTRTPLRFAFLRVFLCVVLGYLFAFPLPGWLGLAPSWGVAGLPASAGVAGWVEFLLLRRAFKRRVGLPDFSNFKLLKLWAIALPASGIGYLAGMLARRHLHHPLPIAVVALGTFGLVYLGAARFLGVEEASRLRRR